MADSKLENPLTPFYLYGNLTMTRGPYERKKSQKSQLTPKNFERVGACRNENKLFHGGLIPRMLLRVR